MREYGPIISPVLLEEEIDKPREYYISRRGENREGEHYWDIEKIYPDPERQAQFKRDIKAGMDRDQMAVRYPRWANLTWMPADAALAKTPNERGRPACM